MMPAACRGTAAIGRISASWGTGLATCRPFRDALQRGYARSMDVCLTTAIGASSAFASAEANDGIDAKAEIRTEALPKNARPTAVIG